ncbi:MAG: sulfatase-like hydrolase/transferase [Pseudomonadota bacterium]
MSDQNNLLIIMSDEHAADAMGCAGHALAHTPTLDALAARGARFTNAYTPSPICVPARAAFHTGRPIHETSYWSSAEPYDGRVPTWGHAVRAAGRRCASVGKLHFRSSEDDNGFAPELLPMHVVGGIGWAEGLLRDPMPDYRDHARELADDVGTGESSYTRYDRAITERACRWLKTEAQADARPFTLFVSLVSPHYPLTAPAEHAAHFDPAKMPLPHHVEGHLDHPVLSAMREFWCYGDYFDEARIREARAAYLGLVSFLDANVARILSSLDDAGLADTTTVLYASDHGELLGNHGFWTKSLMYEDSVRVPLIMAGPRVPSGAVCDAPVSLLDLYPTVLDAMAVPQTTDAPTGPLAGTSLFETIRTPSPDRTVFSEYHDGGSPTGFFMIRWDRWKYIHYVGARPQLFDLQDDPREHRDLGKSTEHAEILGEGEARLHAILDPIAVNTRAFADQRERLEAWGGPEGIANLVRFNHTPVPDLSADPTTSQ